jgi:hypothetical protein
MQYLCESHVGVGGHDASDAKIAQLDDTFLRDQDI